MQPLRVLVACEESQRVCLAFRKRGHEAYSCDLQECSGGHPEWHLQMDCFEAIKWMLEKFGKIDILIGFPPCTYLAFSGLHWIKKKPERIQLRDSALDFFVALWNAPVEKIALENPQGWVQKAFKKPTQRIHPYYFGDNELKRTCLWLKNLPKLQGLHEIAILGKRAIPQPEKWIIRKTGPKAGKRKGIYYCDKPGIPTKEKAKYRSKTFPGIARAMAESWSPYLGNTWNVVDNFSGESVAKVPQA